jgi:hypothetical protein
MATGHDLIHSVESQQIKLEYKLSEVYFVFKEFIECSKMERWNGWAIWMI